MPILLHDMGLEDVPVVLLSGIAGLSEIAAKIGTPYFLSKPFGYQQVVALVTRALAERAAPMWPAHPR